jgi:hypothetical protein
MSSYLAAQQSAAPSACPEHPQFKPSQILDGFQWIGEQVGYPLPEPGEGLKEIGPTDPYLEKVGPGVTGDTFPMTWADDDEIYASAGDPGWGNPPQNNGLDVEMFSGMPKYF